MTIWMNNHIGLNFNDKSNANYPKIRTINLNEIYLEISSSIKTMKKLFLPHKENLMLYQITI